MKRYSVKHCVWLVVVAVPANAPPGGIAGVDGIAFGFSPAKFPATAACANASGKGEGQRL